MGAGSPFTGSNRVFAPPQGDEDRVDSLHVFDNGVNIVSCWKLSEEELAEINQTGCVYLSLWSRGMQPVFVGSENTVRELVADNGVWKR